MNNPARICLLLVEDDILVRTTVALMLEDDGFSVVEAASAPEAIARMRDGLDPVVIVTDVDLGAGPNGMELADELHALRPEIAIIFITGRTASLDGRPLTGREAILPKPFKGSELAQLVRDMVAN